MPDGIMSYYTCKTSFLAFSSLQVAKISIHVYILLAALGLLLFNLLFASRELNKAIPSQERKISKTMTSTLRPVSKVITGTKMREGAGVIITRTVGTPQLPNLDPYLMLDELKLPPHKAAAGFPSHPHRGFETCSIMITGKMEHRDSAGNHGVIEDGGVQWMTAGRGIIHSEMPKPTEGLLWGYQLWINLPKKDKMSKPRYQDYNAKDIPIVEKDGARVRVLAGEWAGAKGPIEMKNPGILMDVSLKPGSKFLHSYPAHWNGFTYIMDGDGKINGAAAKHEQAVVLGADLGTDIEGAAGENPFRFLLIAGQPIKEPIVQHGPFVMNTKEEIYQAFLDYENGKLQNPGDDVWSA